MSIKSQDGRPLERVSQTPVEVVPRDPWRGCIGKARRQSMVLHKTRAAGLADNQFRFQENVRIVNAFFGNQPNEQVGGIPPELHGWQPEGGERWFDKLGERDVVEAYQCYIFRDAEARLVDGVQGAKGHRVGRDEHRRRPGTAREELLHRGVPALRRKVAIADERFTVGNPRRGQRAPIAFQPVGARGIGQGRVRNDRNPPLSEIQEMLCRSFGSADIIYVDEWNIGVRQLPQEDDARALGADAEQFAIVDARTGKHDTVYVALVNETRVGITRVVGSRTLEEDMITLSGSTLGKAAQDWGKKKIGEGLVDALA